MAYQQATIIDARSNVIRVGHPDLPQQPRTSLAAAAASGGASITVGDNTGWSNTDLLVLGNIGSDTTEILTINAAVTPGSSISTTALVFNHPIDSPVVKTLWSQIEISGAATITGVKTVIATVSIQFDRSDTEYVNTGTTYAYYFARYKHGVTHSAYSDAAPAAGYDPDTVRAVKKTALELTGQKVGDIITEDFLNTEVTNCEIDIWKEKRRWAQFDVNDAVLGTLTAGVVSFPLQSDISDPDTNEAIRSIRVRQVGALRYIDREQFDNLRFDVAVTTLAIGCGVGDATLFLTSVADFSDSGSISLGSDSVSYTGRNTTLNTLTGCTGITAINAAGTNVWQGDNRDQTPVVYTVMDRAVNIVLPASADYIGQAIYDSYYSKPTYPDSDADSLNWPDPLLYHYWIAEKILLRLHDGTPTDASRGYADKYAARKAVLLGRARMQDTPKLVPKRPWGRQSIAAAGTDDFVSWIIR